MNIDKLIKLFGKEYRDKELVNYFKQNNFDILKAVQKYMKSTIYQDEKSTVYAENYIDGYLLIFEDELDYFSIEGGQYGNNGKYYFIDISFFGKNNNEGYKQYKGEIIRSITIDDTREIIRNKLGNDYTRHDFLDVDIWDNIDGIKVYIDYRNQNLPRVISLIKNK